MVRKNYSDWSKKELVREINKLEKRRKYGVVWEEKPEKVAELCKEKLPILVEDKHKAISTDNQKPVNILIEGDNYHALSVLNYTHEGEIDIIYIDPPYNTGNAKEWSFNDKYVDKEDTYRHSKWLSFMEKRLKLAKNLLKRTGVMFISIDDNEYSQLKLLCDKLLGEKNFIANFIRKKKGTSTNVRGVQVSPQADYVLCYGRSAQSKLNPRIFSRRERKYPFSDSVGKYRKEIIEKKDVGGYARETMKFQILGQFPRKGKRWQIGEEKARELENKGRFVLESGLVKLKIYDFEDKDTLSAQPNILENCGSTDSAQRMLDSILNKKGLFENPKPVELTNHLTKIAEKGKQAIILDFFAGSGTTAQSVLELNKADNGQRRFILCTNNEGSICTDVCYPRIKKVIEGYKNDNGEKIDGTTGNLRYFTTSFVDSEPTDLNKKRLVDNSTEMLCLKEYCFDESKRGQDFRTFTNQEGKCLGIIYSDDGIEPFKAEVRKTNKKFVVYVFSLDESAREEEFEDMKDSVKLKPIPAVILNVYKRIFK
jgi:adenine-specific DNA-methyltransferase